MARTVLDELRTSHGLDTDLVVVDRELPEGEPTELRPPPTLTLPGDEPVRWIFFTSGTTAEPKGALHSDATIVTARPRVSSSASR